VATAKVVCHIGYEADKEAAPGNAAADLARVEVEAKD
jgi:hypothetical protein